MCASSSSRTPDSKPHTQQQKVRRQDLPWGAWGLDVPPNAGLRGRVRKSGGVVWTAAARVAGVTGAAGFSLAERAGLPMATAEVATALPVTGFGECPSGGAGFGLSPTVPGEEGGLLDSAGAGAIFSMVRFWKRCARAVAASISRFTRWKS